MAEDNKDLKQSVWEWNYLHVIGSLLRYLLSGKGAYGDCGNKRLSAGIKFPDEAAQIEQGFS